ncbi:MULTISPECIES: ABC transporter ATP-binding protein [Microbacterium]|uniref:dipeptide ABC transporter ATP-binding protein n=1 Tax=Microbacterium TaxID=33882 RepID=UPI00278236FA|nr:MULTISPECIES: ABC transporter ATP-binding protein [Microbacterium]MDQ1082264.1 peptide/nickel transport system ATP-binding protein [Microbacterium sp. SORGH_AS_0344]MDQ1168965.1 peptide/nickel transport system ATP-binding protein [Microbacterium proteolyticum]
MSTVLQSGPVGTPPVEGRAVDVAGLTIRSGDRTLVSELSFHIERGERVGLIGESGSGKSLTSLAVMGLLPANLRAEGSVLVGSDPRNLVDLGERELAGIRGTRSAMVFQEPMTALNPLMQVGPQIAEAMIVHGTQRDRRAATARALQLLDDVGIPSPAEAAQAYPHQLSGGQRQRVVLAIALANDPELLVCDEPTTALDVTVQKQVLDLVLATVKRRDTGLLFITHDLAVVGETCERVLVMNKGEVVERGTIDQIFTRPQHPYTRGLLAASDLSATDDQGKLFTVATAANYRPGHAVSRMTAAAPEVAGDVVRVENLTRVYKSPRTSLFTAPREVKALNGVSFSIAAGDRFGIVGESGSGKSTLLRLLSGLDQPTSGELEVVGRSLVKAGAKDLAELRRNLQIVFQDPMASLDPRMRIRDIVAEPLLNAANLEHGTAMNAKERADAVAEMIEAVGLPRDAVDRFPHQFSGGQRQRISIARALVCRPRILVADEPVSALDVSVRAQVLNLLADLVDEYRLTLIFVSHDLHVVRYLCDRVAVMRKGEIVEQGPTESVYASPQQEYTRVLIDATPTISHVQETR